MQKFGIFFTLKINLNNFEFCNICKLQLLNFHFSHKFQHFCTTQIQILGQFPITNVTLTHANFHDAYIFHHHNRIRQNRFLVTFSQKFGKSVAGRMLIEHRIGFTALISRSPRHQSFLNLTQTGGNSRRQQYTASHPG